MKTLIATMIVSMFSLAGLFATDSAEANPYNNNGYNIYHPNGQTTMVQPSYGGGYNVYGQNGSTTLIRPR